MEFFKELFLISEGLDLTLKIKRVNDKLTLSILPENATGVQPLVMTGTYEELDKDFFTHVKVPLDKARVAISNIDNYTRDLEELEARKRKEVDDKKKTPALSPSKKPAPVDKKKAHPVKTKEDTKEDIEEEDDNDEQEIADAKKIAKEEEKPKPVKKETPAPVATGPKQLTIG